MVVNMGQKKLTAAARRAQLIEVGRGVFAERGYEGTSVEEIAERAKVSKPILYEHFGGKEGLYAVIVDREMEQVVSMITEAISSGSHSGAQQAFFSRSPRVSAAEVSGSSANRLRSCSRHQTR